MSEPTLYRKPTDAEVFADEVAWDETGMVPVERCEHGNIDRHFVVSPMRHSDTWCPGAGIGGDDES